MGLNAVAGAWYAIGGAPDVPIEWLEGTPFDDYVIPGLVLGGVVGGTQLGAAFALARRASTRPLLVRGERLHGPAGDARICSAAGALSVRRAHPRASEACSAAIRDIWVATT